MKTKLIALTFLLCSTKLLTIVHGYDSAWVDAFFGEANPPFRPISVISCMGFYDIRENRSKVPTKSNGKITTEEHKTFRSIGTQTDPKPNRWECLKALITKNKNKRK